MKIDEKTIEEYHENGAICLRNVFSKEWQEMVAKGIEKNLAEPGPLGEKLKGNKSDAYYFDDLCNWQRIPEFRKFALESPASSIAGQLMKSEKHLLGTFGGLVHLKPNDLFPRVNYEHLANILKIKTYPHPEYAVMYHEQVLVKEPGTDKETPWHHDQAYYPIDGDKVCSIWMPVDPVPMDTCVQYVAGSHKWGWFRPIKFETTLPYEVVKAEKTDRIFKTVPDIDADRDQYKILCWNLEPGDCIVFHMRTLHGAPGNASTTRRRRALATRWLGEDAVLADRPWEYSPPTLGGLKFGDRAVSNDFPIVWRKGA